MLKNKAIVEEGEKLLKNFKPVDYDLGAQIKAISAFEGKAVSPTPLYRLQRAQARERRGLGVCGGPGRGRRALARSARPPSHARTHTTTGNADTALPFVQVSSAAEAAKKIESELAGLNSTLKNIEDARPFDQLTVSRSPHPLHT